MGHTHSDILIHVVFSTKERQPFIDAAVRERLYEYMSGTRTRRLGAAMMLIVLLGGVCFCQEPKGERDDAELFVIFEESGIYSRLSEEIDLRVHFDLDKPEVARFLVRMINTDGPLISAKHRFWKKKALSAVLQEQVVLRDTFPVRWYHRLTPMGIDDMLILCSFWRSYEHYVIAVTSVNDRRIVEKRLPPSHRGAVQSHPVRGYYHDRICDTAYLLHLAVFLGEYDPTRVNARGIFGRHGVPYPDRDKYLVPVPEWWAREKVNLLHKEKSFIVELAEMEWEPKPEPPGARDAELRSALKEAAASARGRFDLDDFDVASFVRRSMNSPDENAETCRQLGDLLKTYGCHGMSFLAGNYHRMDIHGRAAFIRMMREFDYFECRQMLATLLGKTQAVPTENTGRDGKDKTADAPSLRLCDLAFNAMLEKIMLDKDAPGPLAEARAITVATPMDERGKFVEAMKEWWKANQDRLCNDKASFIADVVKAAIPADAGGDQ